MLGICQAIGEIDTATGAAFGVLVRETIDNSDEPFVSVDCADETFMDRAGYHALVDSTHDAARRGRTLVIRNMSSRCSRLTRLYGWDRELLVEASPRRTEVVRGEVSIAADPCMDRPQGLSAGGVS